ncbi:MAG: macro domain-containing protein [Anaerolineales bacterium]|nr:macro domain-containing protein [Anaerolineales bacterium]
MKMEDQVLGEYQLDPDRKITLIRGDLTLQQVDAIVNAANPRLRHGGGVAAMILRKGGQVINEESQAWIRDRGEVTHESPAYTSGGNLDCRYIIHAVGPIWGRGDEEDKLTAAIAGSLRLADELSLTSIAFSAISTGIFGFPKRRAARVFYQSLVSYFVSHPESQLTDIRMVVYDDPTSEAFHHIWDKEFPA